MQACVQVPRTVDIEVTEDLVGSVVMGDIVEVFGEVKVLATQDTVGECARRGRSTWAVV